MRHLEHLLDPVQDPVTNIVAEAVATPEARESKEAREAREVMVALEALGAREAREVVEALEAQEAREAREGDLSEAITQTRAARAKLTVRHGVARGGVEAVEDVEARERVLSVALIDRRAKAKFTIRPSRFRFPGIVNSHANLCLVL